ncbi:hypothetical protein J2125_003431 [Erwinia toletana]|uniref:Uncharacterized protein n=1 Tax=Winslowiella toletana TaxID=92490 RepID=A0ABS4PC75_9GAMM|nr:hypothetical protein [Winslowiella toletana]MBP2170239.1 hypothetical protein [Winslowiella toletana]
MSEKNPTMQRAGKDDEHPAKDQPNKHGEIPRKRDDSEDDNKDPFKAD